LLLVYIEPATFGSMAKRLPPAVRDYFSKLGRKRVEALTPQEHSRLSRKGGKAWWGGLSEEERKAVAERLTKARKKGHRAE
jgi:hypothetical protein